jgi:beta-lactamase regulating signal transducer with metallopeptidase domain
MTMPLKILILALIFAIPIAPTFWAITDIPKRRFQARKQKMIWFAVVATLPCIGALMYIIFGRRSTEPLGAV